MSREDLCQLVLHNTQTKWKGVLFKKGMRGFIITICYKRRIKINLSMTERPVQQMLQSLSVPEKQDVLDVLAQYCHIIRDEMLRYRNSKSLKERILIDAVFADGKIAGSVTRNSTAGAKPGSVALMGYMGKVMFRASDKVQYALQHEKDGMCQNMIANGCLEGIKMIDQAFQGKIEGNAFAFWCYSRGNLRDPVRVHGGNARQALSDIHDAVMKVNTVLEVCTVSL